MMPDAKVVFGYGPVNVIDTGLPAATKLYSAATIRKWLEEVTPEMTLAAYDGQPNAINAGFAQAYRAMIAAKLQELETA